MTAPGELTCQELVELVTEYLEGTLPAMERERFERHLGYCPGCVNYLAQMQQTIRALKCIPEESIPPQAKQELLDVFKTWKRGEKPASG